MMRRNRNDIARRMFAGIAALSLAAASMTPAFSYADEKEGAFPRYLHAGLTVLPVVEPGLGPPADARLVRIDADSTGDVEALYLDIEIFQRVNDAAVLYGLVAGFFFTPSSHVDRYVPWISAK